MDENLYKKYYLPSTIKGNNCYYPKIWILVSARFGAKRKKKKESFLLPSGKIYFSNKKTKKKKSHPTHKIPRKSLASLLASLFFSTSSSSTSSFLFVIRCCPWVCFVRVLHPLLHPKLLVPLWRLLLRWAEHLRYWQKWAAPLTS